ncbi:hypothetical protein VNO78_21315 [Psophocarpus tetragonolobus]|uniref:Disease resistance protein RGA3 n=1 Tax=Psophocarpus tetragonolobus TaxID=3891 RepID=A0AAN9SBV5_PSOTE
MAESILFAVAESLIGKLTSEVIQKASLALGVYNDLQEMKETMTLMKAVMLDAEQKRLTNNTLSEWLIWIKRVFSDAEDIVDDFECEALRKHVIKTYGSCSRKVCRFFSSSNPLVYRLRMANEMQDINKRLAKLAAQRSMFGLQINEKDTRVNIIELLVQDGHDKSLSVIPIVGIGGLGKITLAKLVFNDANIDDCFSLKMWVCVCNDFELKNLLIKILKSIHNPSNEKLEEFEIEQLQNRLKHTLQP